MVTFSRQAGAGGDEIAQGLAKELGWNFLDREVLEKLLVERGFPKMEFQIYDEKKPGFWHRFSAERNKYLHFLKLVTYEFARQRSCVILGRGGHILLKNIPGTINVRVVAPLQDRVSKICEKFGYDERRARQAVQNEDNDRAGFHRFFFHTNWEAFDLYDMIINTHFISEKTAIDLVKATLSSKEVAGRKKETFRKLEDLYLAQKAVIAILYEQQLPIHFLEIAVENGTITLKGTSGDRQSIERCEEVAVDITGVTEVNNEIAFVPEYVGI